MMAFLDMGGKAHEFIPALGLTLLLSLAGAVLGLVLGFVFNALRLFGPEWVGRVIRTYVWLIRGTPFLVQVFVLYFGFPSLGITFSAIQAGVIGLALYAAAYFSEIFRGAWNAIPHGQVEAAGSLGIGRRQVFWRIQLPQAMTFAMPMLVNQFILTLKESSIVSIITVPELTMTAGKIVAETFNYLGPYLTIALGYWFMATAMGFLGKVMENYFARRLYGVGGAAR
jgi:His/Glu/Gln/Arg/opine family amino acid ABC transporter permease subunit